MGAVMNEQQRIIFKWALKINCVVLLTQSPRCCMVNSEEPGFHCCPVGIWQALGFLIASRLHFRFYLRFQQANHSEPNACDTTSTSVPAAHLFKSEGKSESCEKKLWLIIEKNEMGWGFFLSKRTTNSLWNNFYLQSFIVPVCYHFLKIALESERLRGVLNVKEVRPW